MIWKTIKTNPVNATNQRWLRIANGTNSGRRSATIFRLKNTNKSIDSSIYNKLADFIHQN
jgi:hypothetical protein